MRISNITDKEVYYKLYKEAQESGYIKQIKHPEKGDTWVELTLNQRPF